jgi:glutamate dehydrogenase (NAD(P)+)
VPAAERALAWPPRSAPQNFKWTEEEVNSKLDKAMTDAFKDVWEVHQESKLPLRTSAFVKALQRVTRARIHRGFD